MDKPRMYAYSYSDYILSLSVMTILALTVNFDGISPASCRGKRSQLSKGLSSTCNPAKIVIGDTCGSRRRNDDLEKIRKR